jgi:hypothetical protein
MIGVVLIGLVNCANQDIEVLTSSNNSLVLAFGSCADTLKRPINRLKIFQAIREHSPDIFMWTGIQFKSSTIF